uniref:palindromic element RPE4 domain-containing protein n=1 Tax=Candidatus Rickettsia kedanie TaxID=3115352 RepID=UPI00399CE08D
MTKRNISIVVFECSTTVFRLLPYFCLTYSKARSVSGRPSLPFSLSYRGLTAVSILKVFYIFLDPAVKSRDDRRSLFLLELRLSR